jgi:uncharacterized glyoxalase superfamily protein PhnB
MPKSTKPIPEGYETVTPYLIVEDAAGLITFLQQAFDAEAVERHDDPNGRVVHAVVQIGSSKIMMGQATDEWPALTAMLHLYVEDVDATYRQAMKAGARSIREPEDMFYGDRSGGVADPAANQWWIATHVEDVSPEEIERRQAAQAQETADH